MYFDDVIEGHASVDEGEQALHAIQQNNWIGTPIGSIGLTVWGEIALCDLADTHYPRLRKHLCACLFCYIHIQLRIDFPYAPPPVFTV